MTTWKLYHNPQCSKSREALELLKTHSASFEIIEYLKHPPSFEELTQLIAQLNGPVSSLVRIKEKEYLDDPFDVNSSEEVARQLSKKPRLLERPILQGKDHAAIGRPIDKIEALFKK